ncbi:hypothetical protein [Paraburkholderia sp. MM6662-R1]|uniref:hypothetical protein n=1 Tax=Paraburkholderia sp. MM6662-R1 TaxID=2991066 RepID=UPI003D195CA6
MTLFDPVGAQALLEIPAAELGRRFKLALVRVAGLATVLNLDLSSNRDGSAPRRKEPDSTRRKLTPASLVAKAKLIHESDFRAAMGITDQRLSKDVAARRIFSVDVGGEPYFPTFFLVEQIRRKDLAKVVRTLGDLTGWSKWNFFTTPTWALGDLTPLQALFYGDRKQVLRAAAEFVKR